MDTATLNVIDLRPSHFTIGNRIHLQHSQGAEDFIVTTIGGIAYAVSTEYGYPYTRPQMIAKYRNVKATAVIIGK